MENLEVLNQIKETISEIKKRMTQMEEGVQEIAYCIEKEMFIPEDIGRKLASDISDVCDLNEDCKLQYERLFEENPRSEKIGNLLEFLNSKEIEFKKEDLIEEAIYFLDLHSEDEKVDELLSKEKDKFRAIVDTGDFDEHIIAPYKLFVNTILNKESVDPSAGFEIVNDLRNAFGDMIAAHAVFNKDIDINNLEEEPIKHEDNTTRGIDKLYKKEHIVEEAEEPLRIMPEKETGNEPDEEQNMNSDDESQDNVIEEIKDELTKKLIEKGAVIDCAEELGKFVVSYSDRENKKAGVKALKNDIRNSEIGSIAAPLMKEMYKNVSISESMAVEYLPGISLFVIRGVLEFLVDKGYARKYSLPKKGCFFSATERMNKLYSSVEARKFLKIKEGKNEQIRTWNLSENEATNLFAHTIAVAKNCKVPENNNLEETGVSEAINVDSFLSLFTGAHPETEEIEQHLYVGMFLQKGRTYENIELAFNNMIGQCQVLTKLVFMGATKEHSFAIADACLDFIPERLKPDVYTYSIHDDEFFNYETREIVDLINEVNKVRNLKDYKVNFETNVEQEIEQQESAIVEESEDNSKEEIKHVETENKPQENKKLSEKEVSVTEAYSNAYEMIVEGQTYCAVAYLNVLGKKNEQIKEGYIKLAYATNDPIRNCRYSSDEMFNIFPENVEGFNDYLMVSASLRNFFYNHTPYDYTMKSLYDGKIKNDVIISACPNLSSVIYKFTQFKENEHKGMDACADYRMKDSETLEKNIVKTKQDARDYYDNIICGKTNENASHKRYIETRKIGFAKDGELATYLKAIIDDEKDIVDLVRDYLEKTFIKKDSTINAANIDDKKIEDFIEECWSKAAEKISSEKKSSQLMGSLRQNFRNTVFKGISILCSWCEYIERLEIKGEDGSYSRYKTVKDDVINDIKASVSYYEKEYGKSNIENKAGIKILVGTLSEILSRIDGTYNDRHEKYFYIDFLRTDDVVLDENCMPDLSEKYDEVVELAIENRIKMHSKKEYEEFGERLNAIFAGADDYGSGKHILDYLDEMNQLDQITEQYDIEESIRYAESQAAQIIKSDFEGTIELMENYGQIDNTNENVKEKLLRIADEEFQHACETKNFGFFAKVVRCYENQVRREAKTLEEPIIRELETYIENHKMDSDYEEKLPRIEKIKRMIDEQNYTVAEDLISRLRKNEPEGDKLPYETDYLEEFIDGYNMYMKMVNNMGKSVSVLVSKSTKSKTGRGAMKLADNWMDTGSKPSAEKTKVLLKTLGFPVEKVEPGQKAGRYENYKVSLEKPANGRKENLTHPIAAFGSKAYIEGFRVAILLGKFDADGIIEAIKEIGNAKNTIILLDYTLTLNDRRKIARKIKELATPKVFGIIDRTLLAYLMENYDDMQISKMVMATMMPFSSYQPYVADSASVMPPEIFMGRKDELEKIESPEGVNIVYGGRQLGKSALLRMAQNDIDQNENGDRAILVDIKGRDYKKAVKKIADELKLRNVIDKRASVTNWDELANVLKERLLKDGPNRIPYLLLLLDEADAFIESCEAVNYQPFDALKDIQSVGVERFKFVIAGLRNVVRFNREVALGNNSVLTHLESMTVRPFRPMEARELLEIPLYYLGYRFPADKQHLITMIFARANYFPGLIQMYCIKLVEAMKKPDYAGYNEFETPKYVVNEDHIKKALADEGFRQQVREKFEITLKLDEDNYYYLIALIMAELYHEEHKVNGYTAKDILEAGTEFDIKKISELGTEKLGAFMDELVDLNILRKTSEKEYLFNRYNFLQMMGSKQEVDDKLIECMEEM